MTLTKFEEWLVASYRFLANENEIERLEMQLRALNNKRRELQEQTLKLYEPGFELQREEVKL